MIPNLIIFTLPGFLAGFLLFGLVRNWPIVQQTFFNVKITEIIQILVMICVGFYISYLISLKTSKHIKQREIYNEMLEKLRLGLDTIYQTGNDYLDKCEGSDFSCILRVLRSFSILLTNICNIVENTQICTLEFDQNSFQNNYIRIKMILTSKNYSSVGTEIKPIERAEFDRIYFKLYMDLDCARLNLYK